MNRAEAFTARSAAYDLLARFFRSGLTTEMARELAVLPDVELPSVLPDVDEAAADHFSILGLDALPHASAYLEEDGRLGGKVTDFMSRLILESETAVTASEEPDHITTELSLLSDMCAVEARRSSEDRGRRDAARLQHDLLVHVFLWLPLFARALWETDRFYGEMAGLVVELAQDHWSALPLAVRDQPEPALPTGPDPPVDNSSGLRDLAEYLTRPARSGIVLTRGMIVGLARELGVPRGFGDRSLMLGNLFGSAATYDVIANLVGRLRDIASEWVACFETLATRTSSPLASSGAAWGLKARSTLAVLERITGRIRDAG